MAQVKDDFQALIDLGSGLNWEAYMNLRAWMELLDAKHSTDRTPQEQQACDCFRAIVSLSEVNPHG